MTPIMQLLLVLGLLIAAAKLAGVGASKLGQLAVLGELPAGVPLFPSLSNMMRGGRAAQNTLFAVVPDPATVEALIEGTRRVLGNLDEPGEGILFTLPVSRAVGLR